MRDYYVYIMASPSRTLYIGVTNDIERRVWEHKHKEAPGFTRTYNITLLVYVETHSDIRDAIEREKELKKWRRSKKVALIEEENPPPSLSFRAAVIVISEKPLVQWSRHASTRDAWFAKETSQ